MKQNIPLLIFLLTGNLLIAQTDWIFRPHIESNNFYRFEGSIDGRYAIEMYLTLNRDCCGEADNPRRQAHGLLGWYTYQKFATKIPLVGARQSGDTDQFIKLYVPEMLGDTIHPGTCELADFREYFLALGTDSFQEMNWWSRDRRTPLKVSLSTVHDFSWETTASLALVYRQVEMASFNLSQLSGLAYIDTVEVVAARQIGGHFYAILQFGHLSNPGSSGMGYCGAGYEGYLGAIQVNRNLGVEKFTFYQTESCVKNLPDKAYSYDADHPEKGIMER